MVLPVLASLTVPSVVKSTAHHHNEKGGRSHSGAAGTATHVLALPYAVGESTLQLSGIHLKIVPPPGAAAGAASASSSSSASAAAHSLQRPRAGGSGRRNPFASGSASSGGNKKGGADDGTADRETETEAAAAAAVVINTQGKDKSAEAEQSDASPPAVPFVVVVTACVSAPRDLTSSESLSRRDGGRKEFCLAVVPFNIFPSPMASAALPTLPTLPTLAAPTMSGANAHKKGKDHHGAPQQQQQTARSNIGNNKNSNSNGSKSSGNDAPVTVVRGGSPVDVFVKTDLRVQVERLSLRVTIVPADRYGAFLAAAAAAAASSNNNNNNNNTGNDNSSSDNGGGARREWQFGRKRRRPSSAGVGGGSGGSGAFVELGGRQLSLAGRRDCGLTVTACGAISLLV